MPLSLEIFAPRSAAGDKRLASLLADAASLGVSMLSISGDQGCVAVPAGLSVQMQLQYSAALTVDSAGSIIDRAVATGIEHVLVLGDVVSGPAKEGTFCSSVALVEFIKSRSSLHVAVCGYPRGSMTAEAASYEDGLTLTRRQVAAGAELVICMPTLDLENTLTFLSDIKVPVGDCILYTLRLHIICWLVWHARSSSRGPQCHACMSFASHSCPLPTHPCQPVPCRPTPPNLSPHSVYWHSCVLQVPVHPSLLPLHGFDRLGELARIARVIGLQLTSNLRAELDLSCGTREEMHAFGHARLLSQLEELQSKSITAHLPIHVISLNSPAVMQTLRTAVLGDDAGPGTYTALPLPPPTSALGCVGTAANEAVAAGAAALPTPPPDAPVLHAEPAPTAAPTAAPTTPKLHILHSGDLAEEIANLAISRAPNAVVESMDNFRPWMKQVDEAAAWHRPHMATTPQPLPLQHLPLQPVPRSHYPAATTLQSSELALPTHGCCDYCPSVLSPFVLSNCRPLAR